MPKKSNPAMFLTSKSSKITPMSDISGGISSKIPKKASPSSSARRPWLTIVLGLVAAAGVIGMITIAIVSFVILRPSTTKTTTTSTTSTSTTTNTMCYVPPSPRQSNIWVTVDSMIIPRVYHAATLISQDNSVLITGGGYLSTISASVEKYIPSTGCLESMRDMPRIRYMHSSNQLPSFSDYVVLAGGFVPGLPALDVADLYHPMTGNTITVHLSSGRYLHTSVVLDSSQIVLIGGYLTAANILNTADMLDTSATSTFIPATNTMTLSRVYHTATVLGNNSDLVLVVGGLNGAALPSAYLYHGSSNSFIALGTGVTLSPARYSHTATYLPPPINKVLITGGAGANVYGTMFLFDVLTYTFTILTTTLIYPRYWHTATLLPNGKVLIVGGFNGSSMSTCELIDPSNNYTVTLAANLAASRYVHTTTFIPDNNNGTVLTCGGYNLPSNAINSCELYFV